MTLEWRPWWRQFRALLKKQGIDKRRFKARSCCECFCPLIVLMLVSSMLSAAPSVRYDNDLHVWQPPTWSSDPVVAQQQQAAYNASVKLQEVQGWPFTDGRPWDPMGGDSFDADYIANFLYAPLTADDSNRNRAFGKGMQREQTIQFLPATDPTVQSIAAAFRARFPFLTRATTGESLVQTAFGTEADLDSYVKDVSYGVDAAHQKVFAAVVFQQVGTRSNGWQWSYTLRGQHGATTIDTTTSVDLLQNRNNSSPFKILMYQGGHFLLQNFIDQWIIEQSSGWQMTNRQIAFQPFPTPAYQHPSIDNIDPTMINLFIILGFVLPMSALLKGLVAEKEMRLREVLRIMNLKDSAYFASWFVTFVGIEFLTSLGIIMFFGSSIYSASNKFYVMMFYWFYAINLFAFAWLLSVFFSKASVATSVGTIAYLAAFVPTFAFTDSSSSAAKGFAALLSPVCFGLGSSTILSLESKVLGISASTANLSIDGWTYNRSMGFFVLDFILYMVLAWYLEQVFPNEWGVQRHWSFIFSGDYWREVWNGLISDQSRDSLSPMPPPAKGPLAPPQGAPFESVSESMRNQVAVSLQRLHKEFKRSGDSQPFVAVDNLSLDLYNGEIISLLGHNGAGKTTTISMLCGMIPSTSGDAYIQGMSLSKDMHRIRKTLGFCPQHDVLWPHLTVREHLELLAAIKEIPEADANKAIDDIIAVVGLTEKIHYWTASLSGGQKRKLGVAMALFGDSKVVFLDEPTSGMDPYSRRATWELLKRCKQNRTIVLTTHFLDEADYLSDRIGIMAHGQLKCCGSSLFLKSHYGVGYTLTLIKAPNFNVPRAVNLVQQRISGATVLSNAGSEISFSLPLNASSGFADLFDQLDASIVSEDGADFRTESQAVSSNHSEQLAINNYSISITTLEEVFLLVTSDADADEVSHDSDIVSPDDWDSADAPLGPVSLPRTGTSAFWPEHQLHSSTARSAIGAHRVIKVKSKPVPQEEDAGDALRVALVPDAGFARFMRHFRALLMKRIWNARRDRRALLWTVLYPLAIMFLGCAATQSNQVSSFPAVDISATSLGQVVQMPVPVANLSPQSEVDIFHLSASGQGASSSPATQFTSMPADVSSHGWDALTVNLWLLNQVTPYPQLEASRYAALTTSLTSGISSTGQSQLSDHTLVYYNESAKWSSALGLNVYHSQVLANLTGNSAARIQLTISPLPVGADEASMRSLLIGIVAAMAFSFLPASFASYAVHEKQIKIRHLQVVSGVSPTAYWAANAVFDLFNLLVPGALCIAILAGWKVSTLIDSGAALVMFVGLILFGLSVVPFCYIASFHFEDSSGAQTTMLLLSVLSSAALNIFTLILGIFSPNAVRYMKFGFRLMPTYAFSEMICNMISRASTTLQLSGEPQTLWSMDISGWPLLYMALEALAYPVLLMVREAIEANVGICGMISSKVQSDDDVTSKPVDEDPDVTAERARLDDPSRSGDDILQIRGLRKVYKFETPVVPAGEKDSRCCTIARSSTQTDYKVAVRDLWLGIPQGQCFGYLGINGAGKTTTMKCLTGDVLPSRGSASLGGFDIRTQQPEVRQLLGYLPQFDALLGTLTGREHLLLFARCKGVPEDQLVMYVERLVQMLGLQDGIIDQPTAGYSGGNKRKLGVGLALIGDPKVVLLDEPSTGVDPKSRRVLWNLISSTMKNRCVVLTTHSMEECEALCSARVGIMVGGRLRCLGSTAHLKRVHGDSFQLDASTADETSVGLLLAHLRVRWPLTTVLEQHGRSVKFRIPKKVSPASSNQSASAVRISSIFRLMDEFQQQYAGALVDFAVSECTLEQLFIAFAKQQEEETGIPAGMGD